MIVDHVALVMAGRLFDAGTAAGIATAYRL
jgi:hypothetical protein